MLANRVLFVQTNQDASASSATHPINHALSPRGGLTDESAKELRGLLQRLASSDRDATVRISARADPNLRIARSIARNLDFPDAGIALLSLIQETVSNSRLSLVLGVGSGEILDYDGADVHDLDSLNCFRFLAGASNYSTDPALREELECFAEYVSPKNGIDEYLALAERAGVSSRELLRALTATLHLANLEFDTSEDNGLCMLSDACVYGLSAAAKLLGCTCRSLEAYMVRDSIHESRRHRDEIATYLLRATLRWIVTTSCAVQEAIPASRKSRSNSRTPIIELRIDGADVNSEFLREIVESECTMLDNQNLFEMAQAFRSAIDLNDLAQPEHDNYATAANARDDPYASHDMALELEIHDPLFQTLFRCPNELLRRQTAGPSIGDVYWIRRGEDQGLSVFERCKELAFGTCAEYWELEALARAAGDDLVETGAPVATRILSVFQIQEFALGTTCVFFKSRFGLDDLLWNVRTGEEFSAAHDAPLSILSRLVVRRKWRRFTARLVCEFAFVNLLKTVRDKRAALESAAQQHLPSFLGQDSYQSYGEFKSTCEEDSTLPSFHQPTNSQLAEDSEQDTLEKTVEEKTARREDVEEKQETDLSELSFQKPAPGELPEAPAGGNLSNTSSSGLTQEEEEELRADHSAIVVEPSIEMISFASAKIEEECDKESDKEQQEATTSEAPLALSTATRSHDAQQERTPKTTTPSTSSGEEEKEQHNPTQNSSSNSSVVKPIRPPTRTPRTANLLNELVDTERDYVQDLHVLMLQYHRPLEVDIYSNRHDPKSAILTQAEVDAIFGNVAQVLKANQELVSNVSKSGSSNKFEIAESFARSFSEMVPFLKGIYTIYVKNYTAALNALATAQKTKPKFAAFLASVRRHQPTVLDLAGYLIKPIQRICKYPLFFKQLQETSEKERADPTLCVALAKAKIAVDLVAAEVNTQQKGAVREARALDIVSKIDTIRTYLLQPGRVLLEEFDDVAVQDESRKMVLYSDAILLIKVRASKTTLLSVSNAYKFKGWLDLEHVVVPSEEPEQAGSALLELVYFGRSATPPVSSEAQDTGENTDHNGLSSVLNSPMPPLGGARRQSTGSVAAVVRQAARRLSFGRSGSGSALPAAGGGGATPTPRCEGRRSMSAAAIGGTSEIERFSFVFADAATRNRARNAINDASVAFRERKRDLAIRQGGASNKSGGQQPRLSLTRSNSNAALGAIASNATAFSHVQQHQHEENSLLAEGGSVLGPDRLNDVEMTPQDMLVRELTHKLSVGARRGSI